MAKKRVLMGGLPTRDYQRQWYLANKKRIDESARVWCAANPDRKRAAAQRYNLAHKLEAQNYYRANADRIKARSKENYRQNKEARRAHAREYQRAHLEDWACQKRKRQALKKNNGPHTLTPKRWSPVRENYGGRCAYCARAVELTQDHIDPLSKGGTHTADNVAPACARCNLSKNARPLLVWLARGGLRNAA